MSVKNGTIDPIEVLVALDDLMNEVQATIIIAVDDYGSKFWYYDSTQLYSKIMQRIERNERRAIHSEPA